MKPPVALWPSLVVGLVALGLDRLHKGLQVSWDCIATGGACLDYTGFFAPAASTGWRGGELVNVTPFFDYVLVWNTGISYGLLGNLPVWGLLAVAALAVVLLGMWWLRAETPLTRFGLAMALGGAISNGIDRGLYGAVADFFHFHWGQWSFYIFNIADMAISLGVLLLIIDLIRPQSVKVS